jgi:hypothetical protein
MRSKTRILSNDTPIAGLADRVIGDFWRWAYSDLISNANRGVFAEFLVGAALGALTDRRLEWDAVDLRYRGVGIEVKASGACQTWQQTRPTACAFSISEALGWDSATNTYAPTKTRSAEVYVFCHHAEADREKADALDLGQWAFYVVPTATLNEKCPGAKTLSLARLRSLASPCSHSGIRPAIDSILDRDPSVGDCRE